MTEQTATERLRAMLDERGVEYEVSVENATGFEHVIWHPNKFSQWDWNEEFGAGWLTGWQQGITPEQAIAATLGNDGAGRTNDGVAERKTCRIVAVRASDTDVYWEDTLVMECGAEFVWAGSDYPPRCPYCGGKVVE